MSDGRNEAQKAQNCDEFSLLFTPFVPFAVEVL
jgi:hypothetical protein